MEKELGTTQQPEEKKIVTPQEVYYLRYVENKIVTEISKETGLSTRCIYRYITNFEDINPKGAEQMRKKGETLTPQDYKELLKENAELKKELARQNLRADFYEEMVKYGKETYGIDLKKAGAKLR